MRLSFVMIILTVFVVFAPVSSSAGRPGVPENIRSVVLRIISAYGGEETVEGIKTVHAAGDIEAFMRQDHGTYEVYFKRPQMLRVETKYRGSSETRILNGRSGYRAADGLPLSQAKGGSLLAMVYQCEHFDLPYGLLKGVYSLREKGSEDLGRRPVVVLHLTGGGPPMDVYVDTQTFFILKVTGYIEVAEGRSTALSSEFSDFRKVGGTVFPFEITNYADGFRIAKTTMKTYIINSALANSLFTP